MGNVTRQVHSLAMLQNERGRRNPAEEAGQAMGERSLEIGHDAALAVGHE